MRKGRNIYVDCPEREIPYLSLWMEYGPLLMGTQLISTETRFHSQLLWHNFSVVPCNLHSCILQTESQGHAKLAEMPLHTPTVSLFKHKQL